MILIQIRTYGHGVVNRFIEIANLWELLHLPGTLNINLFHINNNISVLQICRYGFATNKLICLGFIRKPKSSKNKIVTLDYILSKDANYEIDIAGTRFKALAFTHAPIVENNLNKRKKYKPTVISYKSDISL